METTETNVQTESVETTGQTAAQTSGATVTNNATQSPSETLDFSKVNIPEGMVLDDTFKGIAKEIGLTNSGTEKLLGYAKSEIYDRIQAVQAENRDKLIGEWEQQSRSNFPGEKLEIAKRAYQQLADENLRNFMDETGLGNNPAMVGMFYKLGAMMAEGKLVLGEGHATPQNSANSMFAKSISMMGK